ncbi:mannose-1-phosphate guanylyltransferase/mannose-6-phosphate isomerase [Asticcacaulis sp. ZE23SCel15]|uniref:mannose-1-phosphate guanylyltransferase/mannose-6-phosphate isomerase n=1 Tax=Asticcacaulis sp. ZE23SCel15 TaxID=3059027 RepID=UPI00265E2873|nr:mannose-1-phosphate guanylyltransferase/mannose-6-phosphate isomerase [Asticcacaulis sp. ZE23SCel15]WKL58575.1 mannose-1-phosphate guanylyltransferase/mannose-6-phosphate isomerase [Asticcacaulis sp. ZE23SCel15]
MTLKILPVIMSGGSGTRLWPMSTPEKPKQFHALGTENTMIQETALRLSGDNFLKPMVICGKSHRAVALDQLTEAGRSPQAIIVEPMARNTAAVAAVAALAAMEYDPEALVLMAPADHVITRPLAFRQVVLASAEVARERIVTFGIRPLSPETGYGYIQRGEALGDNIFAVRRFLEKPNLDTAKTYLEDGSYDWNAGIFLFSPQVMIEELRAYAPEVLSASEAAYAKAHRHAETIELEAEAFSMCPSISIDYAVMENTEKAAVAPCYIGWADVGGFSELWRLGAKDESGNHSMGPKILIDAENCLIRAEGPPVAVIGMRDTMIISTPAGVLVAPLSLAQEVKKAAEAAKNLPQV